MKELRDEEEGAKPGAQALDEYRRLISRLVDNKDEREETEG